MYTVYIHKNKINNKVYIGITKRKPEERWGSNGNGYYRNAHFYNSIQKCGWNNFEHIIIADNLSYDEACNMEKELISKYDSTNQNKGYNVALGGGGSDTLSEETKRKISESHKGIYPSEETKRKLKAAKTGINNPMYGKKLPDWHKEILRNAITGRKKTNKEIKSIIDNKGYIVFQYDLFGKFLNSYRSTGEAERMTGVNKGSIKQCCNKRYSRAGDYIWRYENDGYKYGENLKEDDIIKPNKGCKPVYQYSLKNEFINEYSSCSEAAKQTGYKRKCISDCANGRQKTAYGFIWKFKET